MRTKRVLFLGCHCDDIELGCGATIWKHRKDWQTFGAVFSHVNPQGLDLAGSTKLALPTCSPRCYEFPVRRFHEFRQQIWETCETLSNMINPDIVFVHGPNDSHQDHQVLYDEAMRKTFKCSIICYYPGPHTSIPNYYEAVDQEAVDNKLEMLAQYTMYQDKPYFDPEYVKASLRVHGIQTGTQYAEAFSIERLIGGL